MNDFKGFEAKHLHDMMKVCSPVLQIFTSIRKKLYKYPTVQPYYSIYLFA